MEKIFQKLVSEGITPNQYFVLYSIRDGVSPSGINISLEMRGLSPDWIEDGKLTGKALSLLIELDANFKGVKAKNDADLMGKDFKEKIGEYRLVFPDKKLPSGAYARSNVKDLEVNFRWFFKTYDYDWDTIIKATSKYVKEFVLDDTYMTKSLYFIKKQDKGKDIHSKLADYCDMIVTGGGSSDEDNFVFSDKVM